MAAQHCLLLRAVVALRAGTTGASGEFAKGIDAAARDSRQTWFRHFLKRLGSLQKAACRRRAVKCLRLLNLGDLPGVRPSWRVTAHSFGNQTSVGRLPFHVGPRGTTYVQSHSLD